MERLQAEEHIKIIKEAKELSWKLTSLWITFKRDYSVTSVVVAKFLENISSEYLFARS